MTCSAPGTKSASFWGPETPTFFTSLLDFIQREREQSLDRQTSRS